MIPEEAWVQITYRAPLWAAIPEALRVQPDAVVRHHEGRSDHYRDVVLERLRNPQCEIAVQTNEYGSGRWLPCGQPVNAGRRCKRHGGPGKPRGERRSYATLLGEIEELRRQLATLGPEPSTRTPTDGNVTP